MAKSARPKPDAALVTQAVELLDGHLLSFGDYRPGQEFSGEPTLFMDGVPPALRDALEDACISAARYLKAAFDGLSESQSRPDRDGDG